MMLYRYTVPKSLRLSCFPVSWTSSISPLKYPFFLGGTSFSDPTIFLAMIDNPIYYAQVGSQKFMAVFLGVPPLLIHFRLGCSLIVNQAFWGARRDELETPLAFRSRIFFKTSASVSKTSFFAKASCFDLASTVDGKICRKPGFFLWNVGKPGKNVP